MMRAKGKSLVVFGGGTMARAILLGGVDAGAILPANAIVCEPDSTKRKDFQGAGIDATDSHSAAIESATDEAIVLLAVKPQSLSELARQLRGAAPQVRDRGVLAEGHRSHIVSILAGKTRERVASSLGIDMGRVIRVMPNTPAIVRAGMTAICAGPETNSAAIGAVTRLFRAVGETTELDESQMDAFTALAGSGPAYLFFLAEAMTRGAVATDIPHAKADAIVRQTLLGAARLLIGSDPDPSNTGAPESPESLRAAVTSKGGTTEAAVGVLEARAVADAIAAAIVAGRDRGRALND